MSQSPVSKLLPGDDRKNYHQSYSGSVYLSGPILGVPPHEARWGWRAQASARFGYGIKVLSPMRTEDEFSDDHSALMRKDYFDIDRCDVMLVNVVGATRVSIGTVAEIGYAYAKGKPIVLVIDPADTIHWHPFVVQSAISICNTLEEGVSIVNALLSEGI